MRWSTSCSSMRSTATVTIEPALTAHMVGTVLGDVFDSVRKVQWAAASFCYTFVGVDAHLGALILMLLGTATTNLDRSFTHSLRTACPLAAPASPGDSRPPGQRAGHRVTLFGRRGNSSAFGKVCMVSRG